MKNFILGEEAERQLAERGIDENTVRFQAKVLNSPPSFIRLERPCAIGDGITALSAERMRFYSNLYGKWSGFVPSAFIPASGAASRMFSRLISGDEKSLESFAKNMKRFAFFDDLKTASEKLRQSGIETLADSGAYDEIADLVLSPEGLGYGNIPKGLVKFHRYGDISKTAFEEHVCFAGLYARGEDGICRIHFTVPRHLADITERHLDAAARRAEKAEVSFSFQNPETDTVAVDENGDLLTDESGRIVFRPAGHGALLENLSRIDSDTVFISNIDNIAHQSRVRNPALARRALAGLLFETGEKIRAFMLGLKNGKFGENVVSEARNLCLRFGFSPPDEVEFSEHLLSFLKKALDRPLRVCGVVRNTGEQGGGPFWAEDPFGRVSPQIVESVQARPDCAGQVDVWKSSTHFNPVDIVCSVKNCEGGKFNLRDYCDDAFMVAEKTFGGRPARALEMPGLWNGAMAGWNTVFAEIPPEYFNPVKDVFDLLRVSHQDLENGRFK